jgi:LysM repeat protein
LEILTSFPGSSNSKIIKLGKEVRGNSGSFNRNTPFCCKEEKMYRKFRNIVLVCLVIVILSSNLPVKAETPVKIYTVRWGDTFGGIAYSHGVTIEQLKAVNDGVDINQVTIGQTLNIPILPINPEFNPFNAPAFAGSTYYAVQRGDTLPSIAKKYGTTPGELAKTNRLQTEMLSIGQELTVPLYGNVPAYPRYEDVFTTQPRAIEEIGNGVRLVWREIANDQDLLTIIPIASVAGPAALKTFNPWIVGGVVVGTIVLYIVVKTSPSASMPVSRNKLEELLRRWSKDQSVPIAPAMPLPKKTPMKCRKVTERVIDTSHLLAGTARRQTSRTNAWLDSKTIFQSPTYTCVISENDGGLRRGFTRLLPGSGGWSVFVMIHLLDDRNPSAVYIPPGGKYPAGFERNVGTKTCCLECGQFAAAYIAQMELEGYPDRVERFGRIPPDWAATE